MHGGSGNGSARAGTRKQQVHPAATTSKTSCACLKLLAIACALGGKRNKRGTERRGGKAAGLPSGWARALEKLAFFDVANKFKFELLLL